MGSNAAFLPLPWVLAFTHPVINTTQHTSIDINIASSAQRLSFIFDSSLTYTLLSHQSPCSVTALRSVQNPFLPFQSLPPALDTLNPSAILLRDTSVYLRIAWLFI